MRGKLRNKTMGLTMGRTKWAGHIARMKDNRWTKRYTEWQPRRGKRSSRRWQDDIARKEGSTWNRKATEDNGRH